MKLPLAAFAAALLAACASTPQHSAKSTRFDFTADPYPSTYHRVLSPPVLLQHATVLTGTGTRLDDADVLMRDGKIVAIGSSLDAPADAILVDARGKWVTPGIIDIHSHLGVYPSPGMNAHSDGNEATSPVTPNVWAEHSIWPQDPGFDAALAGGVTSLQILPGSANLIGVTNDISALSAGSLSHSLLAVSDFLRGDTTYQTGPLVHKRDCFEAGTLHRVPDGEALREGVTYEFRVQYAEALSVAAGMRSEDAGLAVRSELTGEEFPVSDFVWYGSSEHLTGDEYNPYTITFTYTPSSEGSTVCSFVPVNLTGESSALSAAPFRACAETTAPAAETVAVVETPAVVETAVSVTPEATLPTPEPPAVSQTMPGSATPAPLRDAESGAPATRVLLAQTLWTLFDRPAAEGDVYFSDLPADTDAAQAIRWAAQSGLIVGYGDGTFRPDEPVTREQTAVILCRYAALRGADTSAAGDLAAWSDGSSVSPWAQQAMLWAVQSGTIAAHGDGTIGAHETATCGALSEMLMNLQQKL